MILTAEHEAARTAEAQIRAARMQAVAAGLNAASASINQSAAMMNQNTANLNAASRLTPTPRTINLKPTYGGGYTGTIY
jgi:hypothetical protein